VWRLAVVSLVATIWIGSASAGSGDTAGSQVAETQPAEQNHHPLGIVFVLVTAVGLLVLSKYLPAVGKSKEPKKDD
jgi:hypothetical protein